MKRHWTSISPFILLLSVCGCAEGPQPPAVPAPNPLKPAMTDEIGEFDPAAGKEVVTLEAKVTDPITGPLEILKQMQVKLPSLQIEQALNLFNATEGRFPQTHDEFMTQIIKANNLALPQLPADLAYQYDVAGHKLLIVRTADGKIVE